MDNIPIEMCQNVSGARIRYNDGSLMAMGACSDKSTALMAMVVLGLAFNQPCVRSVSVLTTMNSSFSLLSSSPVR